MLKPLNRRRLILLIISSVLIFGAAGGFYAFRKHQIRQRTIQSRADGVVALEQQDYFQALHKLGAYVQYFPADADTLYLYAQARQKVIERNGAHIRGALSVLNRVIELKPDHMAARQLLLNTYAEVGFFNETIATADGILARSPDDANALAHKARALGALRRFKEALPLAEKCGQLKPLDLDAQLLTAELKLRCGQPPADISAWAESLRNQHPEDPRYEVLKSFACAIAEDQNQAMTWVRKAAARDLADPVYVKVLVRQLNALGLYNESFSVLNRLAQDKIEPELKRQLVARLYELERYQEILNRTESPLESGTSADTTLLAFRALALQSLNRKGDSVRVVEALRARRTDASAATWVAVLQAKEAPTGGDSRGKQAQVLRDAVAQHPENAYFRFFAGQAYAQLGEWEIAIQEWLAAAQHATAWTAPWTRIAEAMALTGRPQEAVSAAQAARQRAPKDPSVLATFASVMTMGIEAAPPDALRQLLQIVEEVQTLSPGEPRTLPIRVALLARLGQPERATEMVQSLLNSPAPPAEGVLLRLAVAAREHKLPLEQACFDRSEKAHGLSAELAFAKALSLRAASRPADALRLIEAARQSAGLKGDEIAWQLATVRCLDLAGDGRAKEMWTTLADQHPDDVDVQWEALSAGALQNDRAFRGRVIDRLEKQIGTAGISWKIARARWLQEDQSSDRAVADAANLLNEVVQAAPELVSPRMELAQCLQHLGNTKLAVEQLTAAASLRPTSIRIALRLASALQSQGDFAHARERIERVLQDKSASVDERREAASLLVRQGEADLALRTLEDIRGSSTSMPADPALAALYQFRNQPEKAEAMYRSLLASPTPAVIQSAALFFASRGKPQEAERILAQLDNLKLEAGVKDLILADYHNRAKNPDKALAHARAAVTAAPQTPAAWRTLLSVCINQGKITDAAAAATDAAKALPGDTVLQQLASQGDLLTQIKDEAGLRPILLAIVQSQGDIAPYLDVLRVFADARSQKTPLDQILTRLRQIADRNPRLLAIQNLLSQLYGTVDKLDDAISVATRTMQGFPNDPECAQIATTALVAASRWNEALAIAQQWRQRTLSQPAAADLMIATAQIGLNNPAEAVKQLQPYLATAQAEPDRYVVIIQRYCQALVLAKQVDAAAAILTPLLPKGSAWRLMSIGLAAESISSPGTAVEWLTRVASALPNGATDEEIALAAGWARLAERTNDPSIRTRSAHIRTNLAKTALLAPKVTAHSLYVLGGLLFDASDYPTAETVLRRAADLDPKHVGIENNLIMALLTRGENLVEAHRRATALAQLDHPLKASFLDTLARVCAKMGDYPNAIAHINASINLDPSNVQRRVLLVQILSDSGDKQKAKAALNQLEELRPDPSRLSEESRRMLLALRSSLAG